MAQGDLTLEEDVVKELMLEKHHSESPLALDQHARGHSTNMLGGVTNLAVFCRSPEVRNPCPWDADSISSGNGCGERP